MSHRVVSDLVPFCNHSLDQFRLVCRVRADDEESRRHSVFGQHVEDLWCAKWMRTIVKRQINVSLTGAISALTAHFG